VHPSPIGAIYVPPVRDAEYGHDSTGVIDGVYDSAVALAEADLILPSRERDASRRARVLRQAADSVEYPPTIGVRPDVLQLPRRRMRQEDAIACHAP
jgi:hypothetical protein